MKTFSNKHKHTDPLILGDSENVTFSRIRKFAEQGQANDLILLRTKKSTSLPH